MSQQRMDLRAAMSVVRRYKVLVGIFVGLGIIGGCGYVAVNPPKVTSEAVIVVPGISSAAMATDVVVAQSDPVLSQALPQISPSMSLQQLRTSVQAVNLTSSLIQVTGISTSRSGAESIANSVANSFIAYIASSASPVAHQTGRIFESATTAKGAGVPGRMIEFGLIGAIGGFILGLIIALSRNSGNRSLRERDDIANSIGVPVLAAVRARRPTDAITWTKIFEDYQPGPVEAWQLHRLLDQLGVTEAADNRGAARRSSVSVVSLASDPSAVALGPQIASFAASLGIRTALVIGPQQDDSVVATLRAACSVDGYRVRSRPLIVAAQNSGRLDNLPADTSLAIVVVVLDAARPQMPDTARTGSTLLGITSGGGTADELARAATTAVASGRDVVGIVVANPDPTDQTMGRVPQLGRPSHRKVPTRLTGIPTEARR